MEMNVSQFTTSPANCSALYSVKWYCSSFYNLVSFFLRKIQFCCAFCSLRKTQERLGNVSQKTIENTTQNTVKRRKICAKYKKCCYVKYNVPWKLLRKIQDRMLRLHCANYSCCANYNKPLKEQRNKQGWRRSPQPRLTVHYDPAVILKTSAFVYILSVFTFLYSCCNRVIVFRYPSRKIVYQLHLPLYYESCKIFVNTKITRRRYRR